MIAVMTSWLTTLMPFLEYPFMQRALLIALAIGFLCAVVGVFVTLRSMAFFSDAIAHSALAGIALGILFGIAPVPAAVIFSLIVAMGITFLTYRTSLPSDTVIGVFFSGSMALGVLLIGLQEGYQADLLSYLFGDILAVGNLDVALALALAVVVPTVIFQRSRVLIKVAFSPDLAQVEGQQPRVWDYILMTLLALTVAVSLKTVGIILVSALIIIPAAAARNVARDFRRLMVVAIAVGVISAVLGLTGSYYLDTASGPTIVMVAVTFFVASLLGRLHN